MPDVGLGLFVNARGVSVTKRYTYTIRAGQRLALLNQAETRQAVIEGVEYIASLCDIEFRLITDESKATLRFSFWPNDVMEELGGVPGQIPGALAGSNRKWIALNSERKYGRQSAIYFVMHELGHWLRLKHAPMEDIRAMMHPYGGAPPLPYEVKLIQKRWKVPKFKFVPYQRRLIVQKYQERQSDFNHHSQEWQKAKALRDSYENTPEVDKFLDAHAKVVKHLAVVRQLLPDMIEYSKQYWTANNEWAAEKVPQAHVVSR